jgi:protein-tyrosine kinase
MSKIDEALARARNFTAEFPAPPAGSTGVDFIAEDQPEAPPIDVPLAPVAAHVDEAARAQTRSTERLIEAAGRIEDQPVAEKLMLAGDHAGDRTPVEQYRRLAARLMLAKAEHGITTVMITSALPGEGKTLTASNLALTLSESYKRDVLLVDADLRRPCVHQIFQVPNASGLNDGLRLDSERKVPLMRFSDNLTLLTAGRPDADPMSVLSGARMKRVISEAKDRFEWVLIDTPPIALLTDAHLLSALVDVVVLVVRAGSTPLPEIKKAVGAVGQERVLGVVLNHADIARMPDRYSHYYTAHQGV